MESLNRDLRPNRFVLKRAFISVLSAVALSACGQGEHLTAGTAITTETSVGNGEHKATAEHCPEQIGTPGVSYGIADVEPIRELSDYISDKDGARTNYVSNRLPQFVSKNDTLGVSGAYGFKNKSEDEAYANSVLLTDLTIKSMQEAGFTHVEPVYDAYSAGQDNIATIQVGPLQEASCHDSPKPGPATTDPRL